MWVFFSIKFLPFVFSTERSVGLYKPNQICKKIVFIKLWLLKIILTVKQSIFQLMQITNFYTKHRITLIIQVSSDNSTDEAKDWSCLALTYFCQHHIILAPSYHLNSIFYFYCWFCMSCCFWHCSLIAHSQTVCVHSLHADCYLLSHTYVSRQSLSVWDSK